MILTSPKHLGNDVKNRPLGIGIPSSTSRKHPDKYTVGLKTKLSESQGRKKSKMSPGLSLAYYQ